MTRYYLAVVTPDGLDPYSYASGAVARLQRGSQPLFDQLQVDSWWTRSHFGSSTVSRPQLEHRLRAPFRDGNVDPLLRLIGLVDLAGRWHERVRLISESTAEILLSNRDWIDILTSSVIEGTTLTIVFARAIHHTEDNCATSAITHP